jgi:hypothetical protein
MASDFAMMPPVGTWAGGGAETVSGVVPATVHGYEMPRSVSVPLPPPALPIEAAWTSSLVTVASGGMPSNLV